MTAPHITFDRLEGASPGALGYRFLSMGTHRRSVENDGLRGAADRPAPQLARRLIQSAR